MEQAYLQIIEDLTRFRQDALVCKKDEILHIIDDLIHKYDNLLKEARKAS